MTGILVTKIESPCFPIFTNLPRLRQFGDNLAKIIFCKPRQSVIHLHQAKAETRVLNEELEFRVKKRTAALEAVNKELQDFAYVVSHDLKAPLRGISRLARWLVDDYADAIDAKGQEMAELLIGRVRHMKQLIDGILSYSRIGRNNEYQETFQLGPLIGNVVDSLALPPSIQICLADDFPQASGPGREHRNWVVDCEKNY